jgi:hypothetical protein
MGPGITSEVKTVSRFSSILDFLDVQFPVIHSRCGIPHS